MTAFFNGWIASEYADQDAIKLKRVYIDICDGNLVDGVLFSQIMYWHTPNPKTGRPRLKIARDGHLWLAKRYEDWWDECRINEHTARQSIKRMVERGLLEKKLYHFDGKPTVHLRVVPECFEEMVNALQEAKSSLNRHEVSDAIDMTYQMQSTPDVKYYTETTAETTTETKELADTPAAVGAQPSGQDSANAEPDAVQEPKKRERDPVYDMVAEVWFETQRDTAAFAALGGRIGNHVKWLKGKTISVRRNGSGTSKVPGCPVTFTRAMLERALADWRKDNDGITQPKDVLKFVQYLDTWARGQSDRPTLSPPDPNCPICEGLGWHNVPKPGGGSHAETCACRKATEAA